MDIDLQTLQDNPAKYGFPSFSEYAKNPSKYVKKFFGSETDKFDSVSNGSNLQGLRKVMESVVHEICGYRVNTLEEVEKIARDQGIDLRSIEYKAAIQPTGGGRGKVLVKWMPAEDIMRRKEW